jgi:hypothetical protein
MHVGLAIRRVRPTRLFDLESVIDNALLHDAHFLIDFERTKSEVRAALGLNAASSQ